MKIHVDNSNAIKEMKKLYSELNSNQITLSIYRAINSTMGIIKTNLSKGIRERYNMTPTMVNNSIDISGAKKDCLESVLRLSSIPMSLSLFNPRQVVDGSLIKRVGGRGKKGSFISQKTRINDTAGVVIEIIKGDSKTIKSASLLLRGTNGTVKARGQYSRGFQFDSKEANKSLKGVSLYSAFKNQNIQSRIEADAKAKLRYQLAYEMEKRLKKIGESNSTL